MGIKEAIELFSKYIIDYLTKRFTGKLVFTLDCRDGGIGRLSLEVKQDLSQKELTSQK